MRHYRTFMLALAMGGLLVVACGSDAEALSKPEFIAQANAICQASIDEADPLFEALFSVFDDNTDFDDPETQDLIFDRWADAMDEIEPIFDRQLDDIRALEPPAQDKDFIATLLDDQEAAITEFVRLIDAASAGNEEARAIIDNDEADPFDDVDRRALEYGLTVCGSEDG